MTRTRKLISVVLAVVGVSLIGVGSPSAASAADGTVGVTAGTLRFQAGPATANDIDLLRWGSSRGGYPQGGGFDVFDAGAAASILPTTGCKDRDPRNPHAVYCPPGPIARIAVLAGADNDRVSLTPTTGTTGPNPVFANTTLPARISGGPGNDNLTAGDGPDVGLGGGRHRARHGRE